MKKENKLKTFAAQFIPYLRPKAGEAGTVLTPGAGDFGGQQMTQEIVRQMEPLGTQVPKYIKDRASGWSQLQNLSANFDMQKVQSAFRAAERGDTTQLFAYYRDFFIGTGITAAQLSKRKLATISEPFKIIPHDKNDDDDVLAADCIEAILNDCEYFNIAVLHLMNSILYPVSIIEKTFVQSDINEFGELPIRYKLNKLAPVRYELITYRLSYLPQGPINTGTQPAIGGLPGSGLPMQSMLDDDPNATVFNPDSWEPYIRIWSVLDNGLIDYSFAHMQSPDKNRHIIYRSNLLEGIAPENFGSLGKAVLWWSIMSQLGADVFLRCLQKYGLPFIKAQVDTSQIDTVNQMIQTFGDVSGILNMIAVNKDATVDLVEMNYSGAADAHTKFLEYCNKMISLLICGQTLDSQDSTGGMGSGKDSLQGQVRKDIINYDQQSLNYVLKHNLFKQLLEINGLKGNCPNIVWGGDEASDMVKLSTTIKTLNEAGYELTDDSIEQLSEKLGFTVQRKDVVASPINEIGFNKPENNFGNEEQSDKTDIEENADDNNEDNQ